MQRRVLMTAGMIATAAGGGRAGAQPAGWETIAAPDGSWRIEMPRGYRRTPVPRRDGLIREQYGFATNTGLGFDFSVEPLASANRSPAETAAMLQETVDLAVRAIPGGQMESEAPVQLGPALGRSFTLHIGHLQGTLLGRIYVTNAALFQQMALVRDDQRHNPAIARFLDSLTLR
ncbi:MAG: hypothetical protein ACOY4R_09055 [Pseudomonadota bacterium]